VARLLLRRLFLFFAVGAVAIAAALLVARQARTDPWRALQQRVAGGRATPTDLVRLGEYQVANGDFLGAFELGLKARKADPNLVGAHNLLGVCYAASEQPDRARESFAKAAELDPLLLSPRLNLARLHLQSRDPLAALEALKEPVARGETDPGLWMLVGRAQQARGSDNLAADSFRKALAADPQLAEAHAALGIQHMDWGRYQPARESLDRAYQAGDRSPPTLCYLALAILMAGADAAGAERAEALVVEAGRPNIPPYWFVDGLLLQRQREFGAARVRFEQVLKKDPNHERALFALSECLRGAGRTAEAAATLKRYHATVTRRQRLGNLTARLIEQGPKPHLLRDYGEALLEMGRAAEAEAQFAEWARLTPNDPAARAALARARKLLGGGAGS